MPACICDSSPTQWMHQGFVQLAFCARSRLLTCICLLLIAFALPPIQLYKLTEQGSMIA